jgi:hypothetical protein
MLSDYLLWAILLCCFFCELIFGCLPFTFYTTTTHFIFSQPMREEWRRSRQQDVVIWRNRDFWCVGYRWNIRPISNCSFSFLTYLMFVVVKCVSAFLWISFILKVHLNTRFTPAKSVWKSSTCFSVHFYVIESYLLRQRTDHIGAPTLGSIIFSFSFLISIEASKQS